MKHAASRELYAYWEERRGQRPAPERADIEPGAIRAALSDTFILELDAGDGHSFRLAGTRVCGFGACPSAFGATAAAAASKGSSVENSRRFICVLSVVRHGMESSRPRANAVAFLALLSNSAHHTPPAGGRMAKKCARILAILIRFSQFIDLQIVVFSNQATYRCILLKRSETAAFLVSKKSQIQKKRSQMRSTFPILI